MKNSKKDNKNKVQINDDMFANSATSMSLYMDLVEECEWDAERADELLDRAMTVFINMYEYSQHDNTLISNRLDFNKIFSANIGADVSEQKQNIIMKLLDDFLKNKAHDSALSKSRN